MAMKIHKQSDNSFVFFCPGCNCAHGINSTWEFDGNFENPTINPSILAIGGNRCHSFVKNGKIQFLNDSEHDLKGQTVDIPEWSLGA